VKKDQEAKMHNLELYPFWKMKSTQTLVVRFIPDLNENNVNGFIDEYHFHRVDINGRQTVALCSERHEDNQTCYQCLTAKKAFNRNVNKLTGTDFRKLWRRQQYVGNVIIIEDPLDFTDPKNPKTYRLVFGKQLFNDLKEELFKSKIKKIPSDYYNGNNFVITRKQHGQFPRYNGFFNWKSKLTTKQIALAEESTIDLSELRPTLYSSQCQDELSKTLCWEILGDT
jgi:hypothetical protein